MSVRQMALVWARSKQSGSALLLLLAIADFANDDGFAWPSLPTLAKKIRLSERPTRRLVERLETAGELKVLIGAGPMPVTTAGGVQRTNLYQVLVEGRAATPPPLSSSQGEGRDDRKGRAATPPKPSVEPSGSSVPIPTDVSKAGQGTKAVREEVSIGLAGFDVPVGLLDSWRSMFPQVDIAATLRFIFEYAQARPIWARRRRSWRLTILNWLKREQEKAAASKLRRPGAPTQTMQERQRQLMREMDELDRQRGGKV